MLDYAGFVAKVFLKSWASAEIAYPPNGKVCDLDAYLHQVVQTPQHSLCGARQLSSALVYPLLGCMVLARSSELDEDHSALGRRSRAVDTSPLLPHEKVLQADTSRSLDRTRMAVTTLGLREVLGCLPMA